MIEHVCTRVHVFQCYFANMELLRNAVLRHTYLHVLTTETVTTDYMTSVGLAPWL